MGNGSTILVVDDEPDVRDLFAKFLARKGFIVAEAPNALEALRILKHGPHIDLVLIDYFMPGMNGMELLVESKLAFPTLPVIMMSGSADMRTAAEALREQAFDFLAKPVDSNELLRVVESALKRTHAQTSPASQLGSSGKGVGPVYCTRSRQNQLVTILEFNRPLDEYSQRAFDSSLQRLIADGEIQKRVVIVLRNVPYINNVGMNFLLALYEEWKRKGHQIFLAQLSDPVYKYLKMLGYLDYFPNVVTVQEATTQLS